MQKNTLGKLGIVAVMTLYMAQMGSMIVAPGLAKMAAQFPDNNYLLISTLPQLAIIPASLLAGVLAGKKMSFRRLAVLGSFLFAVGGTAAAFVKSFGAILVCRAVFGFGLGLNYPLANALVLGSFEGQKQARMMGIGTLAMNAGGVIFQTVAGILADISWNATFYPHLFGFVAMIFAFFLPDTREDAAEEKQAGSKEKMGAYIWVIAGVLLIMNMLMYPLIMNISLVFEYRGVGSAAIAGIALSLYTVGGCVAGLTYSTFYRIFKKYTITATYVGVAIAILLILFGKTAGVIAAGLFVIGYFLMIYTPAWMSRIAAKTPASTIPFATSLSMSIMSIGGFICTYWVAAIGAITGDTLFAPTRITLFVILAMALIFTVFNPYKGDDI